eukprot:UN33571
MDDDILYLWEIHNDLNSIAAQDEDLNYWGRRDSWYPKEYWPSTDICFTCNASPGIILDYIQYFYQDDTKSDLEMDVEENTFLPGSELCVPGLTWSDDGASPCSECSVCSDTITLRACKVDSNTECTGSCNNDDGCLVYGKYCNNGACLYPTALGEDCSDSLCADGLVCLGSICTAPCVDGVSFSFTGYGPCTNCQLCPQITSKECTVIYR